MCSHLFVKRLDTAICFMDIRAKKVERDRNTPQRHQQAYKYMFCACIVRFNSSVQKGVVVFRSQSIKEIGQCISICGVKTVNKTVCLLPLLNLFMGWFGLVIAGLSLISLHLLLPLSPVEGGVCARHSIIIYPFSINPARALYHESLHL